jgi:hypothetical protein
VGCGGEPNQCTLSDEESAVVAADSGEGDPLKYTWAATPVVLLLALAKITPDLAADQSPS